MSFNDVTVVVGVSGVGKSTAVEQLKLRVPLLHLKASELLKAALLKKGVHQTSEELRLGPVRSNQELMIAEFQERIRTDKRPVIFDGHVVIEGRLGPEVIEAEVFRRLGVSRFVLLQATPGEIRSRRLYDVSRSRPDLSLEEVAALQSLYIKQTQDVAKELAVPAYFLSQGDTEAFSAVLSAHR